MANFTGGQRLLLLDAWMRSKLPASESAPLVGVTTSPRTGTASWFARSPNGDPDPVAVGSSRPPDYGMSPQWRARAHDAARRLPFSDPMNQKASSVLLACALLSVAGSCSDVALAQDKPATTRWEYGRISAAKSYIGEGDTWKWQSPTKEYIAFSLDQFFKDPGVKDPNKTPRVSLLNHLGADGWELASYVVLEDEEIWYLKRPGRWLPTRTDNRERNVATASGRAIRKQDLRSTRVPAGPISRVCHLIQMAEGGPVRARGFGPS